MEKQLYKIDKTATHTVYKCADGKRVPGVTTILNFINKGDALLNWAYECGLNKIDFRKKKEWAADVGTIAHAMCECYVKGLELDTSNLSPDDVDKAETAFIKFVAWWDEEEFELIESELPLVSELWRVGGTLDILARDRKGRTVLIDLKTSKHIYKEYKLQTAAYAAIYDENTIADFDGFTMLNTAVDRIIICRIGKEEEGDFETKEVHDRWLCHEAFEATLVARKAFELVKQ